MYLSEPKNKGVWSSEGDNSLIHTSLGSSQCRSQVMSVGTKNMVTVKSWIAES